MKKFLVIFLIAALVPFTVGCRLWDAGNGHTAATTATVRTNFTVAASAFPGLTSIRASVIDELEGVTVEIGGVEFTVVKADYVDDDKEEIEIEAEKAFDTTDDAAAYARATAAGATVRVKNGDDVVVQFRLPANKSFSAGTTIEISVGADRKPIVTIGGTTIDADDIRGFEDDDYEVADYMTVVSIEYDEEAVSRDADEPTAVATLTPSFVVEFSEELGATQTWEIAVTRGSGDAIEFDSDDDDDLFTIETDDEEATITINEHETYNLKYGQVYGIRIVSATTEVEGDVYELVPPARRYIETPSVKTVTVDEIASSSIEISGTYVGFADVATLTARVYDDEDDIVELDGGVEYLEFAAEDFEDVEIEFNTPQATGTYEVFVGIWNAEEAEFFEGSYAKKEFEIEEDE